MTAISPERIAAERIVKAANCVAQPGKTLGAALDAAREYDSAIKAAEIVARAYLALLAEREEMRKTLDAAERLAKRIRSMTWVNGIGIQNIRHNAGVFLECLAALSSDRGKDMCP